MVSSAMRQLEERHMGNKIDIIIWSNKMDLLALSNSKGEVCLHRLNWQKAWSLPPPVEEVAVRGIAWRPDGKVIAVGYSNGEVFLVNVENKDIIHKIECKENKNQDVEVTYLNWIEDKEVLVEPGSSLDSADTFLPKLPPISRSFGSISEEPAKQYEDIKLVKDQASLNFLIIYLSDCSFTINVFGILPCGTIQLPEDLKTDSKLISVEMASDLKHMFVSVEKSEEIKVVIYDISMLEKYRREIHFLAYKHGMIISLLDYLTSTMGAISEAYENLLLLEMESKLSKYAQDNPNCSVSSDFLELLVFGLMSFQMGVFLSKDLTEKGIKKLGHTIELSHCNIQKLILKHIQSVCTNIVFHLSDFLGMSRMASYQALGVEERTVVSAYKETGAFLMKANEVQQVIDQSLKKYKAFFKWLHGVIVRISDDRGGQPELTQQETVCIADYLYNLDHKKEGNKYCLDRVGQYLQDKELEEVVSVRCNPWEMLVREGLADNDLVIVRDERASLVQQHQRLITGMASVGAGPSMALDVVWQGQVGRAGHAVTRAGEVLLLAVADESRLVLTRLRPGMPPVSVEGLFPDLNILDLQFYLDTTLSLLLQASVGPRFLQLPTNSLTSDCPDVPSFLEPGALRPIENMVAGQLAVSGARKVAVIVSQNRHNVRTYETEAEEDEEEDEDDMETSTFAPNNDDMSPGASPGY